MDAFTTPSNWQRVRLGDIAEIIGGGTPSTQITSFWNGSINWFTATEIGITKYVYKSQRTITPLGLKKSSAKLLPIGTILLTSRASIGDCAILKVVATTNQDFQSLIPLEKINNEFLYYLILTLKNKLLKLASGSIFLGVSPNKIKNLLIPLPPLNEQATIANVLSDVDRYLYSLDALILKKESVKKALSFELLSQRKRLKGFNQAWQRVRLGTYKYRRGSFPQPYGNPQWYSDNGMPFVQVYDVGENFKLTQKTKQKISKIAQPMSVFVPKNSVIITLQGTIGRVALTQYDCYCDRTILIFDNNTLNDVNKYFFVLSLFTKFEEEKRKADGSIIKTITKQTLKDFEILLPPLDEQIAIANILSGLDSEIISLKNKKRQFENIKKALNHDLMSAKIRVLNK
ncbi:restriction endonuclease subunit S [Helicobacter pylori]|uniref:restriction endonuclease subunit S n=3 Tax=Helicobacter pylori TaxID=210 RepID=UPI00193409FA|nr:restriction endonuclease subunit S [Helicobacter pylori]MBM0604725.1 restriction endonuclease subunit S [Helicobacter pylori]MBM0629985.1 restriction endonuclease subunit S [Helicobacter pylori]